MKLYEEYIKQLRELGPRVETGIFQAEMEVNLINHGPVTLILESTGRMDRTSGISAVDRTAVPGQLSGIKTFSAGFRC